MIIFRKVFKIVSVLLLMLGASYVASLLVLFFLLMIALSEPEMTSKFILLLLTYFTFLGFPLYFIYKKNIYVIYYMYIFFFILFFIYTIQLFEKNNIRPLH